MAEAPTTNIPCPRVRTGDQTFPIAAVVLYLEGCEQQAKAGDLTNRPHLAAASQLRDSAGITPASLLALEGDLYL